MALTSPLESDVEGTEDEEIVKILRWAALM